MRASPAGRIHPTRHLLVYPARLRPELAAKCRTAVYGVPAEQDGVGIDYVYAAGELLASGEWVHRTNPVVRVEQHDKRASITALHRFRE